MVKKSVIYPLIVILTAISWLDAKWINEYGYYWLELQRVPPNGQEQTASYYHVLSETDFNFLHIPNQEQNYQFVPAGTEHPWIADRQVLVPDLTNSTYSYGLTYNTLSFTAGKPVMFAKYITPDPEIEVTIPEQPDQSTFPWYYNNQEPLTNLKKVEQKNFNVDRYYLLEGF